MDTKKIIIRSFLLFWSVCMTFLLNGQETRETTINVEGRTWISWGGPADRFTILGSEGITWLRVEANATSVGPSWEDGGNILYDGVPITNFTVICPKSPPPCEGCGWQIVERLLIKVWGEGSITIRQRILPYAETYAVEGEYIERTNPDGTAYGYGTIVVNPASAQPGDPVNITVTIPSRFRDHITGIRLTLPGPPDSEQNTVDLPYSQSGIYNYSWTIPVDPYYDGFNIPTNLQVLFQAYSNKPNENGQSYLVTSGSAFLRISSMLYVRMTINGSEVQLGSTNAWPANRDREVSGLIQKGQEPFTTRWIVNGSEVTSSTEVRTFGRGRTLNDQNVLEDAGTITFEVTDANGNTAAGTVYVGVKTDLDFELQVQGATVESGARVTWKESSSKMVTARIINGEMPLRTQWYINDAEVMSSILTGARHSQFTDQEILEKAGSVTLVVTDGNDVQVRKTVYFEDDEEEDPEDDVPAVPVGPEPTPPPVLPPAWEPNPTVEWNNMPWLDDRVQQCSREYLQNIVFDLENAYVRWENTALPEGKQRPMWTSIDDWGRILNSFMSTSGGVDGSWDNPTHFVWSEFNKATAGSRYGRTVEYYVKYECGLLEPSPEDLTSAIDDLADDEENSQWDQQTVQDAQNNLDELLDVARELYRQFLANYNKFVDEINDQRTNPTQNEMVAFTLASAQNEFDDHSVNKDSLDALGSALLGQTVTNDDIELTEIIGVLSEVQVQSDDMTNKLAEMRGMLASYGGDVDEILQNGQQIAQSNVDPEFAQDGGVNVEMFGDGWDNIGDGLQDYLFGNVRRGNVLIIVDDVGNIDDDIFEVSIEGRGRLGETPPGGKEFFDISLSPGQYRITLKGLYSNPGDPNCTYGIQVFDRDRIILQDANIVYVDQEVYYYINVE